MDIHSRFIKVLKNPINLWISLQLRIAYKTKNQEKLVKYLYWFHEGKPLNLKKPVLFTEKVQWLKLYNHVDLYHSLVDKNKVKEIVSSIIGTKYIIPTLGVWDTFDEIPFDDLPDQFVLKSTNGGGSTGVVICKNKECFNKNDSKAKLEKSMAHDIYTTAGEWAYKGIKPQIIAEKFMYDESTANNDLTDYKFWCFNGKPVFCQVIRDRSSVETIDFYDMDWKHLEFVGLNPIAKNGLTPVQKPAQLSEMKSICESLSKSIPFVRIDLYVINEQVYFGEETFYPNSGYGNFFPDRYNREIGNLLEL